MTSGSGKPKWNQRPIQSRDNSHDELEEASAKNKREIIIIANNKQVMSRYNGKKCKIIHETLISHSFELRVNEANFSCTKAK